MQIDEVVARTGEGGKPFLWIDILNPTPMELEALSDQYMLPFYAVQDCLDAEHLPKFERTGELNFVILRAFDDQAPPDADTVQELTRKVAIFESSGLVITIHRSELKFLTAVKDDWRTRAQLGEFCEGDKILLYVLKGAIESYDKPMMQNRNLLEDFEAKVFKHQGDTFEDGYYLKRRANTFKRMLRLSLDIVPRIGELYKDEASLLQDIKETGERLVYYADEFYDNISNLVNLHLSLSSHRLTVASHRTNEVVRLLTIFSVLFMPLNLVTGIYGMNFEHMPELKSPYGYYGVLTLMASIVIVTLYYFYRKGLLKGESAD